MLNHSKTQRIDFKESLGPLNIALFMRVARTSLGLTQKQFSKSLGIGTSRLSSIESGTELASAGLAVKVAKLAGLHEKIALQACFQDQVRITGSRAKVTVT